MQKIIPINVDRNMSKKDFETQGQPRLLVTTDFNTFQGEGPFTGHPAYFIRLAGCNIGAKEDCPWCDTAFQIDNAKTWSLGVFISQVTSVGRARLIVVTGGEPLLQWATLIDFIRKTNESDGGQSTWQIETNGQLLREEMAHEANEANIHFVISPKVPHTRDAYTPLKPEVLAQFAHVYLKYVVSADVSSPYHGVPMDAVMAAAGGLPVYVSGMAIYKRQPAKNEVPNVWDKSMIDHEETRLNYRRAAYIVLHATMREIPNFFVSYQTHLFGGVE